MLSKGINLNSIRSKLIMSLVLICVIPLLLVGVISYNQSKGILNKKLNVTSTQTLTEVNEGMTDYFHGLSDVTSVTAKNPMLINIDSDSSFQNVITETLKGINDTDKDILDVYYGTASGKFVRYPYAKVADDYNATTRPWYKQAVENKGKVIITPPYKDNVTGSNVVGIAQTVEKDGKIIGVIGLDCTLSTLADRIATKKVGNSGYVFITDTDGNVLAHPNKEVINTNLASKLSFWDKTKSEKSGFVKYVYENSNKFGVYQTNQLTGWKLVATLDESELSNDTKSILFTILLAIAIMALVSIVVSILLSKGISDNVKKLKDVFAKASSGDLSTVIEIKSKDELGELGRDYNSMIDSIRSLLNSAKDTSDVVLNTATSLSSMAQETSVSMSQVAVSITEISQGTNNLAESSQDSATGVNQLSEGLDDVALVTNDMDRVSSDTKELSDQGIETVNVLISKNNETKEASIKVAQIVVDVDKSVKEIYTISDSINQITEQTNLLSLNASIEAARAGEAGKGFAVVADEIRKLAEQSKASTKQIKSIIETIQSKATTAVEAINGTQKITEEQSEAVEKTEKIFHEIINSIASLTEKVEVVKHSIENMQVQKQTFVNQIESTSAICEETASSTQEVTASTEEVNATMEQFTQHTEELQDLAKKLKHEIDKFKV